MKIYIDRTADSLSKVFPELGPIEAVRVLNDGLRSLVVETPHGEIFKIARDWDAGASFEKEIRVLPALRKQVPVQIPYPVWHSSASTHFPFGVIGYLKVPGSPADVGGCPVARDVAAFLLALHRVDVDSSIAASVPQPRAYWDETERLRNTLAPALRELFSPGEYRVIREWWSLFLQDERMHWFTPVLHHGDFWAGNMLVQQATGRLTGVVDFENLAVGDPAQDFATLLHQGRPFMLQVMQEYQAAGGILDEDVLYRVQRLWELREFNGIGFAIRGTNQQEFEGAVRKLRNGPLLDENTRRETSVWPPQQL